MAKKQKLPFGPTNRSILLICPPGLASECTKELRELIDKQPVPGRSEITHLYVDGNKITCSGLHYREVFSLCRKMSTVYGFYFQISQRICHNKNELKNFLLSIDYEPYLVPGLEFSIRAESFSSTLYHEKMIKEIFTSILMEKGRVRDSAIEEDEQITKDGQCCRFFLHAKNDRVSLYISVAGFALNRRIYKKNLSFQAPLREDIAAALIYRLATEYSQGQIVSGIHAPFCGTGTFIFEALSRILKISSGLLRDDFYANQWEYWTVGDEKSEKKKMILDAVLPLPLDIRASDNNPESLSAFEAIASKFTECLVQNGIHANLEIKAHLADSLEEDWDQNGFSWIMLNPPYGWRLERDKDLFSHITEKILQASKKNSFAGFCLCPEEEDWSRMKNGLGALYRDTVHFSLGGRQIRALYFLKP